MTDFVKRNDRAPRKYATLSILIFSFNEKKKNNPAKYNQIKFPNDHSGSISIIDPCESRFCDKPPSSHPKMRENTNK